MAHEKTRATSAIQLVRATTPRPSSRTDRKNAVTKYGVGLTTGNLTIARRSSPNGSEAASAGMLLLACVDSGKNRRAANSDTEKKNAPDPAATIRKLRKSIPSGAYVIHRNVEKNVSTIAAAMAMRERLISATEMETKSRTSRQSQTAED